jgi:PAS domain S-box-containing protein
MAWQAAPKHAFFLALHCLLLLPPAAQAEQRVRVGIYENSPKVAIAESGKPAGIFVDIIEAIADKEDWKLEYVPGTWSEGLARLAAGKIDLMPDVALTSEREQAYAFHREPVLSSWNQVYARRGSGIRSLLDLDGKRVAVLEGSTQQELFMHMVAGFSLSVTLLPQPDFAAAFRAVAEGRADAVVTNRFYGVRHAAAAGLEDTAIIFSPSRLHFAAPKKGNLALLNAIDRHLAAFKKDSTSVYYTSLHRWTGDEARPATPTWLGWAALAGSVLLLAGFLWVVTLRRTAVRLRASEQQQRQLAGDLERSMKELAEREALAHRLAEEQELLLKNVQVGVLFTGDGRILSTNPKFAEIFGYDSPDELVGADTGTLFADTETYRQFSMQAAAVLNTDRVLDIEWPGMRRDGAAFIGHTVARAIVAPGYRFAAIWMVEDISLRKAAEHAVAELTAFLQSIIDHVANPIFYKGPDLRFRGCNKAYEKAFGVDRADFIGKTVLDLAYLPLADREAYQAEDAAAVATCTTVQREAEIPFADGRDHQTLYSVSGFRSPDGSPAGLVGVIVDITPLKQAEAALAETTAFLDAIVDHIPNPLFYKDAELRFVGCNRANEEAFGVKREDIIGKTVLEVDYLPATERRLFHEEQQRLLREGGIVRREVAMPFADGKIHQMLHSSRAFSHADGTPGGLVGVLVDVTPLKETEAALREAKHAAEAADRIKSAFLATMSHELRTPLNSIIGFTGIILQELAGPLNAEQHKQLGMVRDSSRHLLALINDVLDISKIEAGELSVAAEPFDLAASIAKVASIVQPLAEKKGLALSVKVAEGVGTMVGDARRVEQVLLNLLGNAIKFTEFGAITLDAAPLAAFRPEVDAAPMPAVRLSVTDTGIGIKPEDMAFLFTPFRQVESDLSRNHDGTGLGLAICRRLASLMGGIIEAESRWREGSVFVVTLPLHPPATRRSS